MLLVDHIHLADIIMMETDLPSEIHRTTCELLCKMHDNAMILTYHDMKRIWALDKPCYLQQLEINKCLTDRFPTSWSVQRGHHFFLWKVNDNLEISANQTDNQLSGVHSNEQNEGVNILNNQHQYPSESDGCFPSFFFSFPNIFKRRKDVNKVLPTNEPTHSN